MNWHKFERAKLVALLADRLGMRGDAVKAATEALTLAAEVTKAEFPWHPTVGLIDTDEQTLARLKAISTPP